MDMESVRTLFEPEAKASLDRIAQEVAALTGAALVAIWYADERARRLAVAAAVGDGAASLELASLTFGMGGIGWIAANRTPLEVADVFGDSRFVAADWRRSHRLSSFSGRPLIVGDRLVGVLTLDAVAPIALTASQRRGMEELGVRAAAVLDAARREKDMRRHRDELAASRSELDARVRDMAALVAVSGILGTTTLWPDGPFFDQ